VIGVLLVAHVLEHADLSAVEGDDLKVLRIRQPGPEPDDVLPFALRRSSFEHQGSNPFLRYLL
jgi:hypothetical protein